MGDTRAECRAIKECGRKDVQGVEPAARLTDVLDDEVARVVVFEPLLVLKGVVNLREGHGSGLKPAVEDIGNTTHGRLARRIIRVRSGERINEGTVEVRDLHAEIGFQLCNRAVNIGTRVLRIVRYPHGDRRAPEAVTRNRPVTSTLKPLAEDPVLDVSGGPRDLLVELNHTVTDLGHANEPRGDGLVHERLAAAPAVRVGVHVGLLAHQHGADFGRATRDRSTLLTQVCHHVAVCVKNLHALVIGDLGGKNTALVDGQNHADTVFHTGPHIVFTECGSLVDEAGTIRGRHVVSGDDRPAVGAGSTALCTTLRGIKEIVDRVVVQTHQLMSLVGSDDLRIFTKLLGVSADQVRGDQDTLTCKNTLMIWRNLNQGVIDLRPHSNGRVRRKSPRRGRPDQCQFGTLRIFAQLLFQAQTDSHSVISAILIHIVIHLELVVAQGSAVMPAVRQNAVALVGKTLVIELLECPQDRFRVRHIQGLVVVIKVDPTGLASNVLFPFLGVTEHRGAAGRVEGLDANSAGTRDLGDVFDSQLTLRFKLCGQTVGIPTETALNVVSKHRLVTTDNVLDVAGQKVTIVREAVCKRRAVVEHEFVLTAFTGGTAGNGFTEGVISGPESQGLSFHLREGRAWIHLLISMARVEAVLRHVSSLCRRSTGTRISVADSRGTTPLATRCVAAH